MSRHRHVRQRHYSDDFDDDYDVYDRSFEEEPSFSPDDESFIYDRSRNQANLSSFIDNIDNPRNSSHENYFETSSNKKSQAVPTIEVVRSLNNATEKFAVKSEEPAQFKKVRSERSKTPTKSNITNSKRNSPLPIHQNQKINVGRSSPVIQLNNSVNSKKIEAITKPSEFKNREQVDKYIPYDEPDSASTKENLNLIVVGHVDAGKSTLMGHLLFKLGFVSKKMIQKYEHETEKIGKQSFVYAWVLDEVEEERGRGITMDIGKSRFETATKSITLLDAPGHKDFIPNMITGATQADVALLVIDATAGEFETGFESGGQTREHTLLIRSLGVHELIVVINKMDNVSWSRERFDEICSKLGVFLRQVGFKDADVSYIPCSGLTGLNLVDTLKESSSSWYQGPTLIAAIDKFHLPKRSTNKPFRMCVHDIFKNVGTHSLSGRIETGYISVGSKVSVQPKGEVAVIKSLNIDEESRNTVYAGSYVNVVVTNVDIESICVGHVLCDVQHPIPVSSKFEAKIVIFDIVYPITKGYSITLHLLSLVDPVIITKLNAQLNKVTGELVKKNPRCLMKNTTAIVTIETSRPICLELYKDVREFGRFMLRDSGVTVAAGLVTKIF